MLHYKYKLLEAKISIALPNKYITNNKLYTKTKLAHITNSSASEITIITYVMNCLRQFSSCRESRYRVNNIRI